MGNLCCSSSGLFLILGPPHACGAFQGPGGGVLLHLDNAPCGALFCATLIPVPGSPVMSISAAFRSPLRPFSAFSRPLPLTQCCFRFVVRWSLIRACRPGASLLRPGLVRPGGLMALLIAALQLQFCDDVWVVGQAPDTQNEMPAKSSSLFAGPPVSIHALPRKLFSHLSHYKPKSRRLKQNSRNPLALFVFSA